MEGQTKGLNGRENMAGRRHAEEQSPGDVKEPGWGGEAGALQMELAVSHLSGGAPCPTPHLPVGVCPLLTVPVPVSMDAVNWALFLSAWARTLSDESHLLH